LHDQLLTFNFLTINFQLEPSYSKSMSRTPNPDLWGRPPWKITFTPSRHKLPAAVDFAIIGGGFTGLAAAASLRLLSPDKSVAVFEAARIGAGASGRTGGMVLAETAAGNQPGLGDVLAGFQSILEKLKVRCDLKLNGAWEIARQATSGNAKHQQSPIAWNDSGTLRVVNEVPGGTLDPGKLVSGLARAAQRQGAHIYENHRVQHIYWSATPELHITTTRGTTQKMTAQKILFATNALSLPEAGLTGMHPRLTLGVLSRPVSEKVLAAIGLAQRKPFYTVDFPYLWGRVLPDRSIVWGAGLVQSPDADDLEKVDIAAEESAAAFDRLEDRICQLHPALAKMKFASRWGGPILFRDSWKPVFDWHPQSAARATRKGAASNNSDAPRNAIVVGAYAGHGVALSSYLGTWAAGVLLERRHLPSWSALKP
jgi:glycine/D-amino acid oxidase-like deaminating enzyme